ncbi:NAD(P)H-dependent oxidoreductase [Luteolibacter arcticus]|uniref:FMN dependent NADH:quinone oxidoreductase n=1 Tax=Luteolibacter arcticus TaxID=1581411 RepID=A0ABT3GN24_9BACT|nr:NAD(P)H-dependent oxidoreductase [Luteolibacter arcticus]MCW1924903.1 NAD(P)H-dependent oxidoreductase [Luteolibacter arcticus]
MKTLLVIDSSARSHRSTTRALTSRFADAWKSRFGESSVIHRDLGANPPRPVDDAWIAAAFAKDVKGTPAALAESETFIDEILSADVIVIGAPMYNFGMPASLKAYLDQIVRVGRTFDFGESHENPYLPLIPSKPVVAITSKGSGDYEPGGPMESLNFLEPHLATVLGFIGLGDISYAKVAREEYKDEEWKRMVAEAEVTVDQLATKLAAD